MSLISFFLDIFSPKRVLKWIEICDTIQQIPSPQEKVS